jgi:hypothetical protein|tara:strand:- start:120 stop:815 length:696 start_codon:yes stop_codon:yes gene_type:complete
MKLTRNTLENLIKQVVKENKKPSMILSEAHVDMDFKTFKSLLDDRSKKSQLQRIGIMTSENPRGVEASDQMNVGLMKGFAGELDSKGLDYVSIGGMYGNPENSYIIMNPTMLDMVALGKKYGQAVIIFAQKMRRITDAEAPAVHYRFDYVQTEPDGYEEPAYDPQEYYVKDSRDMVVKTDADDFYSELKGTKFSIPFFSTDTSHSRPEERFTIATDVGSEVDALKGKYAKL